MVNVLDTVGFIYIDYKVVRYSKNFMNNSMKSGAERQFCFQTDDVLH